MLNTFLVKKVEHEIGNHCNECWLGYPKRCECGGFIHAEFDNEAWDKAISLIFNCDHCGDKYKEWVSMHRPKRMKQHRRR